MLELVGAELKFENEDRRMRTGKGNLSTATMLGARLEAPVPAKI